MAGCSGGGHHGGTGGAWLLDRYESGVTGTGWSRRMRLVALFAAAVSLFAQGSQPSVRIEVTAEDSPVQGATVKLNGQVLQTGIDGIAVATVPLGPLKVELSKDGFLPATTVIAIDQVKQWEVRIEMRPAETVEKEITVQATRNDVRIQDSPLRVEVLQREEVEEKMLMTPGDIVMMLNEMGGMRVQTTSPSLGAASVRMQGMRGRYTRFLSDGLPLFGQQGAGLGLLQIPPVDLGQVEVIKGVASSLYGAGAMGGVVNLVSRRPGDKPIHEFLLNRSTRGATDASAFLAGRLSKQWSASLLGSGDWQQTNDIDDDGWADLAQYARGVIRPRFFWDGGEGKSALLTGGVTCE